MLRSTCQKIALLALSGLLVSCGFHLRGQTPYTGSLKRIHLAHRNVQQPMVKALQHALKQQGIQLVDKASKKVTTLNLIGEGQQQQEYTLGANTQVRQYQMTYTLTYELRAGNGKVLVDNRHVRSTREMTINNNRRLGSDQAKRITLRHMYRDVADQLLAQLSSPTIANRLKRYETKR